MKRLLLLPLLLFAFAAQAQLSGYYQEGFESTTFPPTNGTGWIVTNVAGPTYTWARSTAQAYAGVASAFMRYDASAGGGDDWLILPLWTVAATDSIAFNMRLAFAGYAPDKLEIKLSTTTTAPASFTTTLLTLQEGTNYPPNATTWYHFGAKLDVYAGQNVYIAFRHTNNDGDGLYIDNVSIGTKPANSITAVSVDMAAAQGVGVSVTPKATFTNTGSATQTFNVTMKDDYGYTSTQTVTSLAPDASTQVSFTPTIVNVAGIDNFTAYSALAGEANLLDDTVRKAITIYPSFVNEGWSTQVAMPAGRWAFGPASYQTQTNPDTAMIVAVTGGDASFANTASVSRLNTVTGIWQNLAPIPVSRTQVQAFHYRGKIYVIGGYTGSFSPTNRVDIYDIATDAWTTGLNIPTAVGDYASGQLDSLIYIIGGYSGTADQSAVQIYNTTTNSWTTGTPFTGTAVSGARAAITRGKIIMTGGYSQVLAGELAQAYMGTIDVANPGNISWTALPNYPGGNAGRHSAGAVKSPVGSTVYFTAGDPDGAGTSVKTATWGYDVSDNQWKIGPDKPTGVSNIVYFAPIVVRDTLFFASMGGYNGVSVVTTDEWLKIGRASADIGLIAGDTGICNNSTVTLTATNLTGKLQWQQSTDSINFTFIAGATNPVYTSTALTQKMFYRVVSYGFVDSAISLIHRVIIYDTALITAHPSNITACSGNTGSFTAMATGSGLTYRWLLNGSPLSDNAIYSGTATTTLNISNITGLGGGNYALVATALCGIPDTSNTATITEDFTNTWTGATNTLWSVPTNWSCGTIPIVTTNVVIPSVTNQPVVDIPGAICNTLTINASASLSFNGTNNALEVKGSITHTGTFDASLGKLTLSGAGAQNIPGVTYRNLTLSGSGNKTPDANIIVTEILNLAGGWIPLGNFNLTLAMPQAQLGGSASSFIITNGTGLVVGQRMGVGGNPDPAMFPVGISSSSYTPIMLENLGMVDTFSVRVMDNVYVDGYGVSPAEVTNPVVDRTWLVSENTPGGSYVNMTPNWNIAEQINGFTQTHVYVAHYTGGQWVGLTDASATAPAAGTNGALFTAYADSIQSLSPFTVASAGADPLAVKLTDIAAVNEGISNRIDWSSAQEAAGDVYELQRSADARTFAALTTVNAKGTVANYVYYDRKPFSGVNYYRLRMTDAAGKSTYSKIVSATVKSTDVFNVTASPNPVKNMVQVHVNGNLTGTASLMITDATGKLVKTLAGMNSNDVELDLTGLASGLYYINYADDANKQSVKITKQ